MYVEGLDQLEYGAGGRVRGVTQHHHVEEILPDAPQHPGKRGPETSNSYKPFGLEFSPLS